MNNLCLENYGVSTLETLEMIDANGGWLWTFMATTDAYRSGLKTWSYDDECLYV